MGNESINVCKIFIYSRLDMHHMLDLHDHVELDVI